MKIQFAVIALVLCANFLAFSAKSQIAITNINEIAKVKKGTTYILMNDPTSEKNKAYVDVLKTIGRFLKLNLLKLLMWKNTCLLKIRFSPSAVMK